MNPSQSIDERTMAVWRIHVCMVLGFFVGMGLVGVAALIYLQWLQWLWIGWIYFALVLVVGLPTVYFVPLLRWQWYRYGIRKEQIEIRSGLFFHRWILIPMNRVQHIRIQQGPIYRWYDLAEMQIYTAGGAMFHIPGLSWSEAEAIRNQIVTWVKLEEGSSE